MDDDGLRGILADPRAAERSQPVLTVLHVLVPLVALGAAVVLLQLSGRLPTVAAAAAAAFFTVGKLLILAGLAPDRVGMTTGEIALLIFSMDVWVGYVFAFHMHHVYRAGRLGAWLGRLSGYCRYWLAQNPWVRRWALTGVALFVMIPLTGTGAPAGALLGRLVGLRAPATLLAIALGSGFGCSVLYAGAEPLRPVVGELQHEWWFGGIGILILVIVMLLLWRLGRRLSRAAAEFERSTGGVR